MIGNGNNQWEWEENGNKTWLNLGLGMGMNDWEWEEMGLKNTFPLISVVHHSIAKCKHNSSVSCLTSRILTCHGLRKYNAPSVAKQ